MPRRKHDVFVSYAWEDKDTIARLLAEELQGRGFDVWYDDFSLNVGDHLRESIDQGLANSRFGVVILSLHFFAKQWPQYELDGLVAEEMGRKQKVILPVWHNVTQAEVRRFSPTLALTVAARSSDGLSRVADQISEAISPRRRRQSVLSAAELHALQESESVLEKALLRLKLLELERSQARIVGLRVSSWDQHNATVEWGTTATMEVRLTAFRAADGVPVRESIPVQSIGLPGRTQTLTFLELEPATAYRIVAESDDDRQEVTVETDGREA